MNTSSQTIRSLTRRRLLGLSLTIGLVAACAPTPSASPTVAPPKPTAAPQPTAAPKAEPTKPAAAATSAPAAAKPAQKVTLRLDFLIGGHHTGFFVARDKGYYRENGLDVEIAESQGSTQAIQLVGNKNAPFGFADGTAMAKAISQTGIPVKMVAGLVHKTGAGMSSLEESGIKTPKDLEGKIYGTNPVTNGHALWPAFVKINKIDDSTIRVVNVDAASQDRLVLAGTVHFTDGIAGGDSERYTQAGKKGAWLGYPEWGLNVVGHGVVTHNDLIKESPDLVRRFVDASLKGWDFTRQNPDEAAGILVRTAEGMQDARKTNAVALLKATLALFDSDASKGKPTGFQTDKDWQDTVDALTLANAMPNPVKLSDLFTNDFMPK